MGFTKQLADLRSNMLIYTLSLFILIVAISSYLYVTNFILERNMKNGRIMSKANMKLERLLEYLDGMAGTMNYDDNSVAGLEDPRKTAKKYKID